MPILKTEDFTKPLLALLEDLERAEHDLDAKQDAYSRRNYVRNLFAMIDGTIYILKHTILIAAADASDQVSIGEHALLREQSFDIKENGEVRTYKKYPKLADNLLFTKRQLEKHFGLSLNIDLKSAEWFDFKKAIEIRNRVTHPKKLAEFDVSKDEVALARRVGHWFGTFIIDWFRQFIAIVKPVYEIDANQLKDYTM